MKHSDLLVWQKAMDLVTDIYQVAAAFPSEERFGLSSQARRAAVSIPSILPKDMDEIGKMLTGLKNSLSEKTR